MAQHWANTYAYYEPEPLTAFASKVFRMVGASQTTRVAKGLVTRRAPTIHAFAASAVVPFEIQDVLGWRARATQTTKHPRQAEFDGVHLGCRFLLPATHGRLWPRPRARGVAPPWHPAPGATVGSVIGDPRSAADVLVIQWRYGSARLSPSALGWSNAGSHLVPGAPLVPVGHTMTARLPSASSIMVSEKAGAAEPGEQDVFFAHGASYTLGTEAFRRRFASHSQGGKNPYLTAELGLAAAGAPSVAPVDSDRWASIMWNLRFGIVDTPSGHFMRPYHDHHDLLGAMAL